MKKMIKLFISFTFIASLVGNSLICPNCGHTCDEQCTYNENSECLHDCGINPQDILEDGNPKG